MKPNAYVIETLSGSLQITSQTYPKDTTVYLNLKMISTEGRVRIEEFNVAMDKRDLKQLAAIFATLAK